MSVPLGFGTILIAHIMFSISYVVVTVKARLIGFDRHLEERRWTSVPTSGRTFRKVTLPLIAPAVLAAALLVFALSVDDFVITNFKAERRSRSRSYVWGAARSGAAAGQRDRLRVLLRRDPIAMVVNVIVRTAAAPLFQPV
jgi:spermidine/putrescine transport system permease protein